MQSKPILMCWGELHLHQCGFESEEKRTIVWCCEASIYMKQNYTVWPLTRISKKMQQSTENVILGIKASKLKVWFISVHDCKRNMGRKIMYSSPREDSG